MATQTINYGLTKPDGSDPVDISVLNANFDKIDEKIKEAMDENAGAGKEDAIVKGGVLLTATWHGTGPFTQEITLPGVTAHSKIDLQLNATTLTQLITDGVSAIWVQNDNATLTVYTLGAKPTVAMSVQYTRTETIEET